MLSNYMSTVLIKWSASLSTGIPKIDSQHKTFIGLINKTNECVDKKRKEDLSKVLTELLNYARIHFSTEEEIFDKYSYPYSNEHKEEHLKLIEKAISFYDKALRGEDVGKEFALFLKDWLEDHLKKHDFKYAKYFKENKIKVE